jgi:predicted transcriptional regulator
MVRDSADDIFDRLKQLVNQRTVPKQSTSQNNNSNPDLIIEKNPIVIGEDKPKKKHSQKLKKKKQVKKEIKKILKTKTRKITKKVNKKKVKTKNPIFVKEEGELVIGENFEEVEKIANPVNINESTDKEWLNKFINKTKDEKISEKLHTGIFSNLAQNIVEKPETMSDIQSQAVQTAKTTKINDLVSQSYQSIDYNQTVTEAAEIMSKYNLAEIAVTKDGDIIGSISRNKITDYYQNRASAENGNLKISRLMNTKPVLVKPSETIHKAAEMIQNSGAESAFVTSNGQPKGIITKEDISKKIIASSVPKSSVKTIETGFDKLFKLIENEKKISTEKASAMLKIKRETIESWANILEDHNLIKIEYPIVGTIELIKK